MSKSISISLIQERFSVGAIKENTQKIIDLAVTANTDIVVFPELTLTGYPPEDLLFRDDLHDAVADGLQAIADAAYVGVLVVGHPWRQDGCLYNAASVFIGGQLTGRYFKQALPNYGVFDEPRYFAKGDSSFVFRYKNHQFAVLICEDVWQAYPAADARAQGAEFALVLNA